MRIFLSVTIFFFIIYSNVFAMGENIASKDVEVNVAKGSSIFSAGGFISPNLCIDGSLETAAVLEHSAKERAVIIDLKKAVYLETLKVFLKESAEKVTYQVVVQDAEQLGLSTDFLNWTKVVTKSAEAAADGIALDTFKCNGIAARYVRILFPENNDIALYEIEAYPEKNYDLSLSNYSIDVSDTSAVVSFTTNKETMAKIVYGYNYDYEYERSLTKTMIDFAYGKKHVMVIPNLVPQTSYRLQIVGTDYNKKDITSAFILFTTKRAKEK